MHYQNIKPLLVAVGYIWPFFFTTLQIPVAIADQNNEPSKSGHAQQFSSLEEAAKTLLYVARSDNETKLIEIFGYRFKDLLFSGDETEDKKNRTNFVTLAQEKIDVEKVSEDKGILHVGNNDWPFPVPLVKRGDHWQFDAEQGREEIINRRIGRNELNTLGVIEAYVQAQYDYASVDRDDDEVSEYAQKFWSEPGKYDGLYWEQEADQPESPLGPLIAEARIEGKKVKGSNEKPQPFNGYLFRILTDQGKHAPGGKYNYIINGNMIAGFGLLAVPAEYGSTGVMTFMVNHQGKIYQKDLRENTAKLAAKIGGFNLDPTWSLVKTPQD